MYHNNFFPSHKYDANHSTYNTENNTTRQSADCSRSPNAVTASPSPNSPRIKIPTAQRHFDHPHEVDLQEFEAEADFRECMMYQRIMQHRNSRANSLTSSTFPTLIPPTLPLSSVGPYTLVDPYMIQQLRNNASDRQNSFDNGNDVDQMDDSTNNDRGVEELESEHGIFELDM